jgi:hypothetical protein
MELLRIGVHLSSYSLCSPCTSVTYRFHNMLDLSDYHDVNSFTDSFLFSSSSRCSRLTRE